MSFNFFKVSSIALLCFIGVVYTNCGSPFGKQSQLMFQSSPYTSSAVSQQAFERTVYPITRANCVSCHASTQPTHAAADPVEAHSVVISQFKVNFNNIATSRLVAKLRDENHNCWGDCNENAQQMQDAITQWHEAIKVIEAERPPVRESFLKTQSTRPLKQEFDDPNNPLKSNTVMVMGSAALLRAPMVRQQGDNNILLVPNNGANATLANNSADAGIAYFNFTAPVSGQYRVWGLTHGPNNNDNAFYANIPGTNFINRQWNIPVTADFQWNMVPNIEATLTGGNNYSLEVKQREDGTKISAIVVTQDSSFNGEELNDYFGVTLRFDVGQLLGMSDVYFLIDVIDYDAYSYKFSRPRLVTRYENLKVKNVRLLVNDEFNPQHATYTLIDKVATPTDSSLSNYSMIAIKDKGIEQDRISFAFEEITIAPDLAIIRSQESFANTLWPVTRNHCMSCHNSQFPAHASSNPNAAHDTIIGENLVNFANPSSSRLVQKVRTNRHNCGNASNCENIANQFQVAIEEWQRMR